MLFFLACLYVALYYIRPFEWVPGLIGKPIFQILSLVSVSALLLAWGSGRIKLFKYKTDLMIFGFTLAIVLSHLRHGYFTGVVESLQHFFPTFVGYFLVAYALNTRKKVYIFLLLIVGLSTYLVYESYLQVTTGFAHGGLEILLQHEGYNDDGSRVYLARTRWYGVFNDPNDLGLALVLVIPFLLEYCFQRRWLLPILTLPPILCGVYWTNSRGAALSLAAGVFSYLVLRYRSFTGVLVGIFIAFMGMTFGPSRMSALSGSEESAYGRINSWYEGFQMFKSYPLFGVGSNMFTEHHSLAAHNSYILVLSEMGIVGSIFFTGIFLLPILYAKKQLLAIRPTNFLDEQLRREGCALIGGLVGVMAAMFFLSRSYIFLPYLMVALIAAFSEIQGSSAGGVNTSAIMENIQWKPIFFVVLLEILFINLIVKVFI